MQLEISWHEIVLSFKKKVEENVNSSTHRRVLFDTTNILVDGMKMKWLNILLLDTLLTVFNFSDSDFALFELNRRRKFDQYDILTTSIIDCCSRAYVAEAVKDLDVKLSSNISIINFFEEWTDINVFMRLESEDRSNRSWRRRILATEMMKSILDNKRMTLPMLVSVVVGRIYNEKFLHKYYVITGELLALNMQKPLISTNQMDRFHQLLSTLETLENSKDSSKESNTKFARINEKDSDSDNFSHGDNEISSSQYENSFESTISSLPLGLGDTDASIIPIQFDNSQSQILSVSALPKMSDKQISTRLAHSTTLFNIKFKSGKVTGSFHENYVDDNGDDEDSV